MFNGYIKIIDWYIIKKYLGTYLFTMAIFAVIIVVFDVSERLDDFMKHDAPFSKIVFEYYAGLVPFYLNMLSPLINFIAVIFFTAKMADQTEIVPILSGGITFKRFLFPYFIASSIVFSVVLVFNLFIIPKTNQVKNNFWNIYIEPKANNSKQATHMQLDQNTYVYIENFDNGLHMGYNFVLEKYRGDTLREKIVAQQLKWDSTKVQWQILNYYTRRINGLKEHIVKGAEKDTTLDMRPKDFEIYDNLYDAMSMHELNERISKEKIRGTGAIVEMELKRYDRFVYPLSAFILTLMGVSVSSRKVRGGVGLPLGIGILFSFIYIVMGRFSMMFALKGGLPPLLAASIPNLIFTAIGIYLLIKAPK